jgi:radical SAM superfamily enzyme YgiQ (UPF0313 family)
MSHPVFLADLTYTQHSLQSEIIPHAIGCVGAFAQSRLGGAVSISLFKRPEKLAAALEHQQPKIVAFSSYAWNFRLSYRFAAAIKQSRPETVTIFGGPNYPGDAERQAEFLRAHPAIDFFIVKEGELPFANLTAALVANDFRLGLEYDIPSVHYFDKSVMSARLPGLETRLPDLADIPSPYLLGLLDEFIDDGFQPIIQTNRGCPFSCTFCVEGEGYYSRVIKKPKSRIDDELHYIGQRMAPRVAQGKRADLFIADSNFGMFAEDIDTAHTLRDCQDKYDWPQFISVATGKNQKERVIEAARLVRGALRLSGSVQSLDEEVLDNIKRRNVAVGQLLEIAQTGGELGANTYSELILALPGQTVASYEETVAQLLEMGFNNVETYTLMLLYGTEMESAKQRALFDLRTKFRVIPRCFGHYDVLGQPVCVGEIEEVVIATRNMTYEEYVSCRKLALLVTLFHNDGYFDLGLRFLKQSGTPVIDAIKAVSKAIEASDLLSYFNRFAQDTQDELWDQASELEASLRDPETISRYISGELGNNILYRYKSLAMVEAPKALSQTFEAAIISSWEARHGVMNAGQRGFVAELMAYSTCRMQNLFHDREAEPQLVTGWNFEEILDRGLFLHIGTSVWPGPAKRLAFVHDHEQKRVIHWLVDTYGSDERGLTRLVTRCNLKQLLRKPASAAA